MINNLNEKFMAIAVDQQFRQIMNGSGSQIRMGTPGIYVVPACSTLSQMNHFVHELPPLSSPDVFGMHPNAAISCDQNEANGILSALVALEPRQHTTASSKNEVSTEALCMDLLSKVRIAPTSPSCF